MFDTEDVGVFLGLDVGKSTHHGHGLTPAGKKVRDKQLPNSEPKRLRRRRGDGRERHPRRGRGRDGGTGRGGAAEGSGRGH
ncbi:hypothetical protein GCM10017557_81520 [Streptomyces aurantiacus]|uniref:IS110 family transposase n=1 Tax=Streptomyces aurantiacus TaxID=47760 RepID=A0A7G1PCE2_9ACTN|nr:hypothetical protein GCM10017557_81520 [Streptomyces aurantiacus]